MQLAFSRRTDLALQALRILAATPGSMPGSVLAKSIGTSVAFLPQVMSPLIQAGWVWSGRGPGGGYRITEAAEGAALLDVIEATGGPVRDGRCALRGGPCPADPPCPIHAVWMEAHRLLVEGFGQVPAVLIEEGPRR